VFSPKLDTAPPHLRQSLLRGVYPTPPFVGRQLHPATIVISHIEKAEQRQRRTKRIKQN